MENMYANLISLCVSTHLQSCFVLTHAPTYLYYIYIGPSLYVFERVANVTLFHDLTGYSDCFFVVFLTTLRVS
jgi:hypothetical protein